MPQPQTKSKNSLVESVRREKDIAATQLIEGVERIELFQGFDPPHYYRLFLLSDLSYLYRMEYHNLADRKPIITYEFLQIKNLEANRLLSHEKTRRFGQGQIVWRGEVIRCGIRLIRGKDGNSFYNLTLRSSGRLELYYRPVRVIRDKT